LITGSSRWDQQGAASALVSDRSTSHSDGWNSSDAGKDKSAGEKLTQVQQNHGWEHHPGGAVDRDSSWDKGKESTRSGSGWDVKGTEDEGVRQNRLDSQSGSRSVRPPGGDRQDGSAQRAGSGWDQQAPSGPEAGGWDPGAGRGTGSSNWDKSTAYSPATQSGASYSPTQSGWNKDSDQAATKPGSENAGLPSSQKSSESSWNRETESTPQKSSGWDRKEPGVPGLSDSGNEPAAPGTADHDSLAGPGSRAGYNPAMVWSGAT
jgi:penicillin-binding protein 1A